MGEVTLTSGVVEGPSWAGHWERSSLGTVVPRGAEPAERGPRCPPGGGIGGSSFAEVAGRAEP